MCGRVNITAWLVLSLLALLGAGCSARPGTAPESQSARLVAPEQLRDALPALPSGEADARRGAMIDSDAVTGMTWFAAQNAAVSGTDAKLSAPLYSDLAYTVYQVAARPDPAVPYMVTANCRYLDIAPQFPYTGKGYLVAWANYAAGRWELAGLETGDQSRVRYPAGSDPVSPGGFLYVAVLIGGAQFCDVHSVQIGYDTGLGYEDYTLGAVQGEGVGNFLDIQLDLAGQPQIAYMHGDAMGGEVNSHARIAHFDGAAWRTQNVDTLYNIENLQFAIGDAGRRALVVQDESTHDLHLLFDDGSGTFASDYTLTLAAPDTLSGIVFINGADNPAGELDTVLCAFVASAAPPNAQTAFFRLTGGGLPVTGNIIVAPTRQPGRLSLARRADRSAVVAIPTAAAFPVWDADFGSFSALANAWIFLLGPSWAGIDVDDSNYTPAVTVRELGGGGITAAYRNQDNDAVVASDLVPPWTNDPNDTVYSITRDLLDYEPFPDGRMAFLGLANNYSATLHIGRPASGTPWTTEFLFPETFSCIDSALAIDGAGVCHVAGFDPLHGIVWYGQRLGDGTFNIELVDTGGLASSISPSLVRTVAAPDSDGVTHLHVFYSDVAHLALLHSENVNGVWIREGEIINNGEDAMPGYAPFGSGYLENTQRVWVTYASIMDFSAWVLSRPASGGVWQAVPLSPEYQEFVPSADDGTNVGGLVYAVMPGGGHGWGFCQTNPLVGGKPEVEIVSPFTDTFEFPVYLTYNTFEGRWAAIAQDSNDHAALYYIREEANFWAGPYTVARQLGATGEVACLGLQFNSTGDARAVLLEQPDGSTLNTLRVYGAATGTTEFSSLGDIYTWDKALLDIQSWSVAGEADSEPYIGVCTKPLPDTTWDIDVFTPSGLGWGHLYYWSTPCSDVISFANGFGLAPMPGGEAAVAVVETDDTQPDFGRVTVHYPW